MTQNVMYIGMDLGTFKTSVASSTGRREVLQTAVGWPKDHVARTMLGRDMIFGKDVNEHRLALNIVRPFEKGMLKYGDQAKAGVDEKQIERHKAAAKLIVDHAVALMQPPAGVPVYGVIGAPARASVQNKQFLLEATRDAFEAAVIVSEPFTVAYGMGSLCDTIVVDIGAGTIDICPMYGTYPKDEDQVTLPIGGDCIDETFYRLICEKHAGVQLSMNRAREIKEKYGFVHDSNESVVVTLSAAGKPKQMDLTEPLKAACRKIVDPIVQGIQELIAKLDPEFQQRLLNNIVLAGGGSQLKGLDRLIEESLVEYGGANVTKVYDSVFAGAVGALKLAMGMQPEYWNQLKQPEQPKAKPQKNFRKKAA